MNQEYLIKEIEKIYYSKRSQNEKTEEIKNLLNSNLSREQYDVLMSIFNIVDNTPICNWWHDVKKWEYSIIRTPDIVWTIKRDLLVDVYGNYEEEDEDLPFDDSKEEEEKEDEKEEEDGEE